MQVLEDTSMQVEAMGHQNITDVLKINRKRTDKRQYPAAEQINTRAKSCRYCGRSHPMKKKLCPAYGKFCSKCGKSNHFSTVCLSHFALYCLSRFVIFFSTADPSDRTQRRPLRNPKRDVGRASKESDADSVDSDMDPNIDFVADSVRHLTVGKIKINRVSDFEKAVPIVINDVIVHMEPDSGTDVSVMDERQYDALKCKSYEDIVLKTSRTKLNILQNELQVTDEFTATARNQTRGAETTFIVVKGKIISPPLLGRNALFELGMLDIRPDGSLKETNELRRTDALAIKSVLDSKVKSDVEKILKQHDKVFQGIGKIFDVRNNEGFLVKFSMKADATPVA